MIKAGDIVHIDLSLNTQSRFPSAEKDLGTSFYGRGFNVAYLLHHLPPQADPLGPENILVISCGLLTGTAAPSVSRIHISALSPQTGLLGSSNVGGNLGIHLRLAGIQSLIITGKAAKPSYLLIQENSLEIREAEALWGLDTWETMEKVRRTLAGEKLGILSIGPAGERMVPFACIMADRDHAAGRTGMGAVLGSKHLKAIVVKRSAPVPKPHSAQERAAVARYVQQVRQSPEFKTMSKHGGAGYVKWADDMGILATLNYRSNHFAAAERIDGKNLSPYKRKSMGCYRCPVQCKAELLFPNGNGKRTSGVRPEFESMVSLGSKCGVEDPKGIVRLDNLCCRLGLDTISAGGVLAFAMDLFDHGILTREDTGGLDIRWGDVAIMERLLRDMASRKGFGAVLALGTRDAAWSIGKGSDRYAFQVKGLELSAYHPSYIMGTALSYAVSTRGGDFNDFFPSVEYIWSAERAAKELGHAGAVELSSIHGKGALVKRAMLVNITLDCLGLCKVPSLSLLGAYDLELESDLASNLTGRPVDPGTLFHLSEKIVHMERLFNIRHGLTPENDRLPEMFFEQNTPRNPHSPESRDWLQPMVQDFYRVMGWDHNGIPKQKTLADFGIHY